MTNIHHDYDWNLCQQGIQTILNRNPTPEELSRLQQFSHHLLTWNQSFNLIGPAAATNLIDRHILDSLTLHPYLTPPAKIADMGSGAGFPGLILAILSDESRQFHLYESSQKKTRFLNFIVTELGLHNRVTIHCQRVEQATRTPHAHSFDFATSRALGDLQLLAKLTRNLLRPHGICLALKGRRAQEELDRYRAAPESRFFLPPTIHDTPGTGDGVIIRLQKVSRETRSNQP